ncbi:Nup133p Ecym_4045 [Eremothecium cymbalariae DBVPG|uniref:Nucleoporin Nup133/Nup155-like N-terminal domain-containing protein n=1 Tax=Eremothecium cymbalariae (strain CBS 270.75 / DBVPG 7215 / KCTC 17166 / NRRL Y-17582) TaxID=931890 RepID=G8JSX3_ERECY|nr:hypothetical protein Ecym_4045 [Eremothecium cymbalariae DBVPG\
MAQPLFQLRKELSLSVSEDISFIDDRSSHAATADSSALPESTSNKFTNEVVLTENSKYVVSRLAPNLCFLPDGGWEIFRGSIDNYSGNALCNDKDNLYIWPFNSSQKRPNFIRIPLHEEDQILASPPRCCFTWPSAGDDNDQTKSSGILIVNHTTGLVQFYEDINTINSVSTLISKTRVIELDLKFKEKECVADIINAEPTGVLVSTSFGRLLLITIRDGSGKPRLQLKQQLVKSQVGFFSSSMNSFKEIVSIRPGPITGKGERLLSTITRGGDFKVWNISATMNSYKRIEVNIYEQILDSLQGLYPFAHGSLQVLDSHPLPHDPAAHLVLASIFDNKESYYILTTIKFEETSNSFSIFSVYRLNTYIQNNQAKPHLFIPGGLDHDLSNHEENTPVYILFQDAVVMTQASTKLDSNYPLRRRWEDIISLRDDAVIIGYGYANNALCLINKNQGVLKIQSKPEHIGDIIESRFIKSHIDQAVYFSQVSENPIEFNLPNGIELEREEIEEDLLTSGNEILLSASSYIPPRLNSLASHLQIRVDLFENLLQFTRSNFNHKISPQCKLTLIESFEILKSSLSLLLNLSNYKEFSELWKKTLMSENLDEEQLFISQLNEFPGIFEKFLANLDEVLRPSDNIELKAFGADLINSVIYQACLEEGENEYRYGKLNLAITEINSTLPWFTKFSIPVNINKILLHLVYSSDDISLLSKFDKKLLDLIKTLYYMCKQSDIWYRDKSTSSKSEDYEQLMEFYNANHLTWVQILAKVNRATDALQIADFYHDLGGLVEILNGFKKEQAQPIYEEFFAKYDFQFAESIFTSFIEQGRINDLFFQFPNYHHFLIKFFETHPQYGYVSWLGNIFDEKYSIASEILTSVATSNTDNSFDIDQRQVQLSIAKLSALATEEDSPKLEILEVVQPHLDLIDAQKNLFTSIQMGISFNSRYRKSGKEVKKYYESLIDKIKRNSPVSLSAIVDLYTSLEGHEGFYSALKLLTLDRIIPDEERKMIIAVVWRRCILMTDWKQFANDTETPVYFVLLKFFRERLFDAGIQLPDFESLSATSIGDDIVSALYGTLDDSEPFKKLLTKELEDLRSLNPDFQVRLQSLIGSASNETGSKFVINYETNTVE